MAFRKILRNRLMSQASLCALLFFPSISQAYITLRYTDPWDNSTRNLQGAVLKLYSTTGPLLWTSPPSDADGRISVSGVVPNTIGYGTQFYITVKATNSAIRIIQRRDCFTEAVNYVIGLDASLYPVAVYSQGSSLDGRTINVGDGYIPLILDMGAKAQAASAAKFNYTPPTLDVYWDPCLYSGDGWAHFTGLGGDIWSEIGSFFAGTNATMRKKYMTNKIRMTNTVAHEYGHYLHYKLAGNVTLPGGGSHTMFSKGNAGLAFSEGWAEFFAEYVLKRNGMPSPSTLTELEDFPQNYGGIRGTDQEGHVGAFFWDLFDGDVPNNGDEANSCDWLRAKAIFGQNPRTAQEFIDKWNYSYSDDYAFQDTYKRTFFFGFPGHTPPVPARKMKLVKGQYLNGNRVTRPLMVSAHEVTQGEYYELTGKLPSKHIGPADFTLPVETVTWFDAILFCNALSRKHGLAPVYSHGTPQYEGPFCSWLPNLTADMSKSGYRLPTKEEWIWSYKGGTTTPYYWGSQPVGEYAWYSGNAGGTTHPVGQKSPNAYGLHDIAGNVREWVWNDFPNTFSGLGGGYSDYQGSGCAIDYATPCFAQDGHYISPALGFRVVRNYVNPVWMHQLLE